MAERVCFQLQVKPDRVAEYRQRHAAVWPQLLAALRRADWRNYSLFLRDDGLLVGYFETDSLAAARAAMTETTVNAQWQSEMAGYFVDLDQAPDTGFLRLTEIFNLDDQLAARSRPGPSGHGEALPAAGPVTASREKGSQP